MNTIGKYILIFVLISSCSIQKLKKYGVYKELPPKDYNGYVLDTSNVIIDVRTPKEYNKSHIKGAINVSYFGGHFKENFTELDLDTTKTILIYCETQHRSLMVANKIYKSGFNTIIDLDKGMRIWRKKELTFEVSDSLKITN